MTVNPNFALMLAIPLLAAAIGILALIMAQLIGVVIDAIRD